MHRLAMRQAWKETEHLLFNKLMQLEKQSPAFLEQQFGVSGTLGAGRERIRMMGWDGMGWDGMGWDGMGWDGMGPAMGMKPLPLPGPCGDASL